MSRMTFAEREAALTLAILNRIKEHPDEKRINSKTLQDEFSIDDVKVCKIVRLLKRTGESVGSDHRGYFYDESGKQLARSVAYMERRAKDMLSTAALMRQRFAQRQTETLTPIQ